jgi:ABC-type Fe3+ transport system permease subunit
MEKVILITLGALCMFAFFTAELIREGLKKKYSIKKTKEIPQTEFSKIKRIKILRLIGQLLFFIALIYFFYIALSSSTAASL